MNLNPLDLLFGQVRSAIENHASPNTPGPAYDANPLLGMLGGLFGQHAQEQGQQFGGYNTQSSDQDPYGDPGQQGGGQFGNAVSSDKDPYGDPGLQR